MLPAGYSIAISDPAPDGSIVLVLTHAVGNTTIVAATKGDLPRALARLEYIATAFDRNRRTARARIARSN